MKKIAANTTKPLPLTPKEKAVLEFVQAFIEKNGFSPSFTEIKIHFGFSSINSIQNYIKQLSNKGYIFFPGGNSKRAISVLHSVDLNNADLDILNNVENLKFTKKGPLLSESLPPRNKKSNLVKEAFSLPLLGKVAAGKPLESFKYEEFIETPPHLVKDASNSYALEVSGNSMIEEGIFDKDVILVEKTETARDGEIVVAVVNEEATVKRFFNKSKTKGLIELRPANSELSSQWYYPEQVSIRGRVVGLMRKF